MSNFLFSRGSSQPRDPTGSPTLQADSLPSESPGKLLLFFLGEKKKSPFVWSLETKFSSSFYPSVLLFFLFLFLISSLLE